MKHGCPQRQQSQNMAKKFKSYILTSPRPHKGQGMSVKCEEPIDELTVQAWLLYHHLNFKYCTLTKFVCKRDGITDRQTDKQTDGQLLDAPGRPFRRGHKKTFYTTQFLMFRICLYHTSVSVSIDRKNEMKTIIHTNIQSFYDVISLLKHS